MNWYEVKTKEPLKIPDTYCGDCIHAAVERADESIENADIIALGSTPWGNSDGPGEGDVFITCKLCYLDAGPNF